MIAFVLNIVLSSFFLKAIVLENSRLLAESECNYLNQLFSGREYEIADSLVVKRVLKKLFLIYEEKGVLEVEVAPYFKNIRKDTVLLYIVVRKEKVTPLAGVDFRGNKKNSDRLLRFIFSSRKGIFNRKELIAKARLLEIQNILRLKNYYFVRKKDGIHLLLDVEETGRDFIEGWITFGERKPEIRLKTISDNFLGMMLNTELSLFYHDTVRNIDFRIFQILPFNPHYSIGGRVVYNAQGGEYAVYLRRVSPGITLWAGLNRVENKFQELEAGLNWKYKQFSFILSSRVGDEISGYCVLDIWSERPFFFRISDLITVNLSSGLVETETGVVNVEGDGICLRLKAGYGIFRGVAYRGLIRKNGIGMEIPRGEGIFMLYFGIPEHIKDFNNWTLSLGIKKKGILFDNIYIFR